MDNYNYPMGADTKDAPWNSKKEKEIEVSVSITLSKTVKVNVTDYIESEPYLDEDGLYTQEVDYSECDLKKAVEDQIYLPGNSKFVYGMPGILIPAKVFNDLSNWNVDDFEVILE